MGMVTICSRCIESRLGEPIDFRETDTEFLYGASREIARNLGTGDGSYGEAAVKAMTTIGLVSREMLGAAGTYSGDRAKEWGQTGPPQPIWSSRRTLTSWVRSAGLDLGRAGGGNHQRISRHDLHRPKDSLSTRTRRFLRGEWDLGALHATWPAFDSIDQERASFRAGDLTCPAARPSWASRAFRYWRKQSHLRKFSPKVIAGHV